MVAVMVPVLLGGCGTIVNTIEGPRVYGGFQRDLETIGYVFEGKDSWGKPLSRERLHRQDPLGPGYLIWLILLDIPISFVADTLALPLTLWIGREPGPTRR